MKTLENEQISNLHLDPEPQISKYELSFKYRYYVEDQLPDFQSVPGEQFEKCFWLFLYYYSVAQGEIRSPILDHKKTLRFKCEV